MRYLVVSIFSAGLALPAASGVAAQTCPNKPIRIVTAEVGGWQRFSSTSNINRLNNEIVRVLRMPETKERLFNAGVEVVGKSLEEFAAVLNSEMTRMGMMIKAAGIRDE